MSISSFNYYEYINFFFELRRDGVVGTTGYGLEDLGVGFRVPVGSKISSSSCRPDRLCMAHPASYSMGTGGSFPGGKANTSTPLYVFIA
jgi:hypothetical protein